MQYYGSEVAVALWHAIVAQGSSQFKIAFCRNNEVIIMVATEQELQEKIVQARRQVEAETQRNYQLDLEIATANRRQELRRQLESINETRDNKRSINCFKLWRLDRIDEDLSGDHMKRDPSTGSTVQPGSDTGSRDRAGGGPNDGRINITSSISRREYIWKLQGMSWLKMALAENGEDMVFSDQFDVGRSTYEILYAPIPKTPIDLEETQLGSLAIIHCDATGVIFRYRIYIKHTGGEFVMWGDEGNECFPDWNTEYKAFGPDVQPVPEDGGRLTKPIGIFGLSHEQLLKSKWIEDDTLTVKVQIEEMDGSNLKTRECTPRVVVPPATLGANLLSLLDEGKHTDMKFIVEGREIKAHSLILAARSEVFDRELNGGMQESLSKVVTIIDADQSTFEMFISFLYTDDLEELETKMKKLSTPDKVASSSTDSIDVKSRSFCVLLQSMLMVSHKYEVQRLRMWCEQKLCDFVCKDEVCSILCQAHLFGAEQLEKACLSFIKTWKESVMATPGFGTLSAEWPEVMLKLNIFMADLPESRASEAVAAHDAARQKKRAAASSGEEIKSPCPKRPRDAA